MSTDGTNPEQFRGDYVDEPYRAPAVSVLDAWDRLEAMYRLTDIDEDGAESNIFRGLD